MSFLSEVAAYVGRIRDFRGADWAVYLAWVGLMIGLAASTGGFLWFGHGHGATFPGAAWLVPIGASVFAVSIAIDTIGHRTVYKEAIAGAEGLVHGITIFCGIGSTVLLCAAYRHEATFWIPAMVLTVLSFVYSLVDEAFHFRRYVKERSDRVEMWSHVGILVGHGTMMVAWWVWYFGGYGGVAETVARL
ncbi:MAG TPA: hypothetical protein VH142_13175 [Polyangiaceae bacterium]|jgi:hypothetical protein|nr:hypothetical protein [Polyangiaceae bacterium]